MSLKCNHPNILQNEWININPNAAGTSIEIPLDIASEWILNCNNDRSRPLSIEITGWNTVPAEKS